MTDILERLRGQVEAREHHLKMYPNDRATALGLERLRAVLDTEERRAAEMARTVSAQQAKWDADRERIRKREEARKAEQAEKTRAIEEARAEEIEADLRRRYEAAAPGPVSDSEWNRVRGQILHDYRLSRMTNFEAEVKATSKRIRF